MHSLCRAWRLPRRASRARSVRRARVWSASAASRSRSVAWSCGRLWPRAHSPGSTALHRSLHPTEALHFLERYPTGDAARHRHYRPGLRQRRSSRPPTTRPLGGFGHLGSLGVEGRVRASPAPAPGGTGTPRSQQVRLVPVSPSGRHCSAPTADRSSRRRRSGVGTLAQSAVHRSIATAHLAVLTLPFSCRFTCWPDDE